jgi:alcohol dehydrogenase (cytochrome c)
MKKLWLVLIACALTLQAQVSLDDIRNDVETPGDWLSYSGGYEGWRHSRLSQITPANVGDLRVKWVFQRQITNKFETTPLVHDGVMYLTVPPNEAFALDAETGRGLWHYVRDLPPKIIACCGEVNRGLAILGDKLFMATLDAHVIALDRKTGRVLWDSEMIDYTLSYSGTHAPLIVGDKVIVGVAGAEYGIRGFLDAYDVNTGERLWRFYTVPGEGEFGNDTWAGDSWKTGGGSIWVTPSYDPVANLIYVGIGNPGPDWNGDVREGDNLFTDSVVALDADSGKRKWHFQFTPHDTHDWDAVQVMALVDKEYKGKPRKLLITANRNGFYYVLDRLTGEFLAGQAFVKQTWAKGLDEVGRPMRLPNTDPSDEGVHVYPMVAGGTNWMSPSYSPVTDLFYVTCREGGSMYYKGPAEYRPGTRYWGSMFMDEQVKSEWYGAVRALNPLNGDVVWEHKMFQPAWAGLLSTSGGLVFAGTQDGWFKALDAASGKELWRLQVGGIVQASPISYLSRGEQQVAIAAGQALFVFALGR